MASARIRKIRKAKLDRIRREQERRIEDALRRPVVFNNSPAISKELYLQSGKGYRRNKSEIETTGLVYNTKGERVK